MVMVDTFGQHTSASCARQDLAVVIQWQRLAGTKGWKGLVLQGLPVCVRSFPSCALLRGCCVLPWYYFELPVVSVSCLV